MFLQKNIIKTIIQVTIGIILISVLISWVDWREVQGVAAEANLLLLLPSILIWFVSVWVSSYRWKLICDFYQLQIKISELFNLYWVGAFFNNFLPSGFGGDSYKFIYLSRKFAKSKKEVFSSIFLDRAIGLIPVVLFGVFALVVGSFDIVLSEAIIEEGVWRWIIFLGFFTLLIGIVLVRFSKITFIEKIFQKIKETIVILISYRKSSDWHKTILASIIFYVLGVFSFWIIALAFGVNLGVFELLFTTTLIHLVKIFPISINSIGVTEGAGVYFLTLVGVSPPVAIAILIATRLTAVSVSLSGGVRYLFFERR